MSMKGRVVSLSLFVMTSFAHAVEMKVIEQLIEQGQHQKALSEINIALKTGQDNVALQTLQADALAASGKEEQAIKQYQELIKQYPDQAELYNNLAILLSNQGDYEAAREILDKGLKTSKTYAVIYDNLSNVYMEMARDSYGKALQLGVELKPLALKKLAINAAKQEIKPVQDRPVEVKPAIIKQAETTPVSVASSQQAKAEVVVETKPLVAVNSTVTAAAADVNSSKQDVIDSLQSWAAAWSAQASDLYLSFYHHNFGIPGGMKRSTWEAQRKQRLRRPQWIQIELDDMKVEIQDKNHAHVTLVQSYRSNGYQDKTRKQILMANTDKGWRIMQEQSLGLVK